MRIGVPRERYEGERRVAATPNSVRKLVERGFAVTVEAGAGAGALHTDTDYSAAGAQIVTDATEVLGCDLVLKVRPPTTEEAAALPSGGCLISFIYPSDNAPLLEQLAAQNVTTLAMDCVPRISRAQKMDALSSMSNISGYKAVLEAANLFGSFFTGQITAAGKVPPAKVLIIGAGVAGLAAIAASRGLGAITRAFDTRLAAREQVESLGAEFLELEFDEDGDGDGGYAKLMSKEFIDAEMALFAEQAKEVDIVITTALIPGRKAPILWDQGMVELMKPGSVIVDLAAERGGNCALTQADTIVEHNGVRIVGYTDFPSRLATTASQLYATNILHFLTDLGDAASFDVNVEDEVIRGALATHEKAITWPAPRPKPVEKPKPVAVETPKPVETPVVAEVAAPKKKPFPLSAGISIALACIWLGLRLTQDGRVDYATVAFLQHLTVFVLACFIGWQVVWNVTAALHTPLMSVTNAISGIIVVGGMLQISDMGATATILGAAAVFLATINIAGGFLVTQRMLRMFRRQEGSPWISYLLQSPILFRRFSSS